MYKIFLSLWFLFVVWRLADCLDIKYMGLGNVFNNGCDLIFALSTAALTGQLVVSGFLWDKHTVFSAEKKMLSLEFVLTVLCVCVCVCVLIYNIIFY